MTHFCTLFDSNYLTRGLALYHSLESQCEAFHLYVVAFNQHCYDYLANAKLPFLTPIRLQDFEDEKLLGIKSSRSVAEYCWTCTASVILYSIEKFDLPCCTYVDADMIFYSDPEILFRELNGKSVAITEHNYTHDYDQSEKSGRYCVQFMYFRNNQDGLTALRWWRERCIEWCYARVEDGKFGDQKYLDDWLTRFKGVHVIQHAGAGIAPWNVQKFDIRIGKDNDLEVRKKGTDQWAPLVFYHFHGVKFYTDSMVSCCGPVYEINEKVKDALYKPYFRNLLQLEEQLKTEGVDYNTNGARSTSPTPASVRIQFLKDRFALLKAGNIGLGGLHFFSFAAKHDHFQKTNELV